MNRRSRAPSTRLISVLAANWSIDRSSRRCTAIRRSILHRVLPFHESTSKRTVFQVTHIVFSSVTRRRKAARPLLIERTTVPHGCSWIRDAWQKFTFRRLLLNSPFFSFFLFFFFCPFLLAEPGRFSRTRINTSFFLEGNESFSFRLLRMVLWSINSSMVFPSMERYNVELSWTKWTFNNIRYGKRPRWTTLIVISWSCSTISRIRILVRWPRKTILFHESSSSTWSQKSEHCSALKFTAHVHSPDLLLPRYKRDWAEWSRASVDPFLASNNKIFSCNLPTNYRASVICRVETRLKLHIEISMQD